MKDVLNQEISVISLIKIIRKFWIYPIVAMVICGIVSSVYAWRKPNIYMAKATLIPPNQQGSAASALLSGLSGLGGLGVGSAKAPNDIYVALLQSRTMGISLAKNNNVMADLKINSASACGDYIKSMSAFESTKDGLLLVQVKDTNPIFAAKIANSYAKELQNMNNSLALTSASQKRLFLESRYNKSLEELQDAENNLNKFQKKTGVVDLESQGTASLTENVSLRNKYIAKKVEVENLKQVLTMESPQLKQAMAELKALGAQVQSLNMGSGDGSAVISKNKIIGMSLDYQRSVREVKLKEAIFEVVAKQYEAAKMEEANQAGIIQVLDSATVPKFPIGPRRALITLLGCCAGLFLGLLLVGMRVFALRIVELKKS